MTPATPELVAARRAVSVMFLANGIAFASWAARIPAVRERLALSDGSLGLALVGTTAGAMVAFRAAGPLVARYGSRRITRVAAALLCAALPLPALAPTFGGLVVALVGLGAANGLMDVAMNAQAVEVERRFGRPILSAFHGMFSLGGLVGASAGAGAAALDLPPSLHLALVAALLAAGSALAGRAQVADTAGAEQPAATTGRRSTRLLLLGVIALCSSVGEGAMADWSAVYLRSELATTASVAAIGYAAYSLAMLAGRFSGDRLAHRLGAGAVLRIAGLVVAGGLGAALAINLPLAMMLGFACVGTGLALVVPLVFRAGAGAPGVSPGQALATLATLATMSYGGFLAGPPLIGFIADRLGLRVGLAVIVPLALVIAGLAPLVGGRDRRIVRSRS